MHLFPIFLCLFFVSFITTGTSIGSNSFWVGAQNESNYHIFMSQINNNTGSNEKTVDIYSHLGALSNVAVITALFITILTFIFTYRHSKKTEQLKRMHDIKNTISSENHLMIQNLLSTRQAELGLSDELVQGFFVPLVDAADWACFLIESNDIDKKYEEHLKGQIKEIYHIVSTDYPKLLQNNNYKYLKKVISKWEKEPKPRRSS